MLILFLEKHFGTDVGWFQVCSSWDLAGNNWIILFFPVSLFRGISVIFGTRRALVFFTFEVVSILM